MKAGLAATALALIIGAAACASNVPQLDPRRSKYPFPSTKDTGNLLVIPSDSLDPTRVAGACIQLRVPVPRKPHHTRQHWTAWRDSFCVRGDRGALFEGVPAGPVVVWSYGMVGYEAYTANVRVVAGRTTTWTMRLRPVPVEHGRLSVTVLDSLGRPVAGASVSTNRGDMRTDSRGVASFDHVLDGRVRLSASAAGFDDTRDTTFVRAGQETKVTLRLRRSPPEEVEPEPDSEGEPEAAVESTLRVRLVDERTSRPVRGVTVWLEDALGLLHAARTDSLGDATIVVRGSDVEEEMLRVWTSDTLGYRRVEFRVDLWSDPIVEMPLRRHRHPFRPLLRQSR